MNVETLPVLTVCQPYADLIAHGVKLIENRVWRTAYRGPLVIHAGKSRAWMPADIEAKYRRQGYELRRGVLSCVVEVVDCVRVEALPERLKDHDHAFGPWCWLLENPRILYPLEVKGAQGMWRIDRRVVDGQRVTHAGS